MLKSKVVVGVGPCPLNITGQAESFEMARRALRFEPFYNGRAFTNGLETISLVVSQLYKLARFARNNRIGCVYITPSRSLVGLLRDSLYLCVVALLAHGYSLTCHWHGGELRTIRGKPNSVRAGLIRLLFTRARHIAITEGMAEDLKALGLIDVVTIINCVDRRFEKAGGLRLPKSYGAGIRICFVSNLIAGKGLGDFAALCKRFKGVNTIQFSVVGKLVDKSEARILENLLQTNSNVVYRGGLSRAALVEFFKGQDLLIFPSRYPSEASPLVISEAIASGLSVVAYKHNYVGDLNGVLDYSVVHDIDEVAEFIREFRRGRRSRFDGIPTELTHDYWSARLREVVFG